MKRTPAKVFMTFAVMLMGLLGFQAGANAVPMTPVENAAITAPAPEALNSQYILNKYVQKVHHRCWRKRVRTLKYCCGFDYYGACIKTCCIPRTARISPPSMSIFAMSGAGCCSA